MGRLHCKDHYFRACVWLLRYISQINVDLCRVRRNQWKCRYSICTCLTVKPKVGQLFCSFGERSQSGGPRVLPLWKRRWRPRSCTDFQLAKRTDTCKYMLFWDGYWHNRMWLSNAIIHLWPRTISLLILVKCCYDRFGQDDCQSVFSAYLELEGTIFWDLWRQKWSCRDFWLRSTLLKWAL